MANSSSNSNNPEEHIPLYTALNRSIDSRSGEGIEKSVIKLAIAGKVNIQDVCNLLRRNGKLTQTQVEALMKLVQEQKAQSFVSGVIGNGHTLAEQKQDELQSNTKPLPPTPTL